MSATSIISTTFSYDDDLRRRRRNHSSYCSRYWFHTLTILLLIIIVSTSAAIAYVLYQQTQRDRERRRLQNQFKQKHGVINKVLDMINKDGIIAKWLKSNKSQTGQIFKQLLNEMVETIFEQ